MLRAGNLQIKITKAPLHLSPEGERVKSFSCFCYIWQKLSNLYLTVLLSPLGEGEGEEKCQFL